MLSSSFAGIAMGVQGKMRGRMEKYVVLPFSMGCVSQASVAVAEQRPRRSKADLLSPSLSMIILFCALSFMLM